MTNYTLNRLRKKKNAPRTGDNLAIWMAFSEIDQEDQRVIAECVDDIMIKTKARMQGIGDIGALELLYKIGRKMVVSGYGLPIGADDDEL